MKRAILPSGQSLNAAYHSRVNPEPRRYRNGVIQRQRRTGPCILNRHCIYNDNSNKKKYIALIYMWLPGTSSK